jgi:hypothetical protein
VDRARRRNLLHPHLGHGARTDRKQHEIEQFALDEPNRSFRDGTLSDSGAPPAGTQFASYEVPSLPGGPGLIVTDAPGGAPGTSSGGSTSSSGGITTSSGGTTASSSSGGGSSSSGGTASSSGGTIGGVTSSTSGGNTSSSGGATSSSGGTATPAVPEPGTWTMMLLGFGIVGVGMRQGIGRKRTA